MMNIEPQVDFMSENEIGQSIVFSAQLIIPQVPLVAVCATFTKSSNKYTLKHYPIVAVRQSIRENYFKEEVGDVEEEPCYHHADDFEEHGYQYTGRTIQTEMLVVNDRGQLVNVSDLMDHRHAPKGGKIIEASWAVTGYIERIKETEVLAKKEVKDFFDRLNRMKEDCYED